MSGYASDVTPTTSANVKGLQTPKQIKVKVVQQQHSMGSTPKKK